jgi:hypothetical protein
MPIVLVAEHASRNTHTTVRRARLRLLLGIVLTAAAACSGIDAQTNSFSTLDEARQAGAIANGWIPDGLPPGSHDIREGHVPGTPQRWGVIEFPQSEEASLRTLLQPEEIPLDGQRCEVPGRVEWWPVILRGTIDGERVAATQLRAYRARQGDLMFAVNWNQGRAYFWTPPSR